MKSLIILSFFLSTVLFGGSLNENRSGSSSVSDTSSEIPLSMFYGYDVLLQYSKDKAKQYSKIYSYYTNYSNKINCIQGAVDGAIKITSFVIPWTEFSIYSPPGTQVETKSYMNKITSTTCKPNLSGGDATGVLSQDNGDFSGKFILNTEALAIVFSMENGLISKRNGKPFTSVSEKTILPLYGGLMMISTDGSNFTLYKGFWNDEGEQGQVKFDKEVKYACGLVEKAKTLKGKKVSESQAREFFKNITPCSIAPKINPGTVVFDLQQNIVLGQKIVLNEKSSKEKSSSSSTQELRY